MDRDETALLLVILVCGAVLIVCGALSAASSSRDERSAWRTLWAPAFPASIPLFALMGWAVADPEGPERLSTTRLAALLPFAFVWLRAAVRAIRSARARSHGAALTKGLLAPRVEVSPELRAVLDPAELRAVRAHEEAHARHRDPLRIWLGQAITDLQWPIARARTRQRAWLRALELARDEEAVREDGVDAAALASALVKAARLSRGGARPAASLVDDDADLLSVRVARLLGPREAMRSPRRSFRIPLMACLAATSFAFGMFAAEPVFAVVTGSP